MSADLKSQLQSTLGSSYTLHRELGGGGMSRVFVADENRLGRRVVVKVLAPELAAGISAERFEREIKVAASLQQANIVPVLAAGDTNGLPYFTMPFVEGESLRSRLAKSGAFSITEVVGILRDVARALSYAHEHGVVHRDIKPDNVLLSGGTAVVTDFGIAKALSASRTESGSATLTQLGTSIGTPAYMSPEQAEGDPDIDHRADIYAFGCMAYELLAGRPPFQGRTPQRVLAAQMGEAPQPILEIRADTPTALAEVVMQCLAKGADARPQSAADIGRVLDVVTSGSAMQAMPPVLLGGQGMLKRALAIYGAAFVVVAVVARAAIIAIGLPDWVFPGALTVMALGLPVILFTAYVHRTTYRALTATPALTPGGGARMHGTLATLAVKASPHVSWRRTALGGAYALGAFIVLIAVFMTLRTLGIGPAGTLIAAGVLGKNDKLIVADFGTPASDTLLGSVVTETLRTELAQSSAIAILPATTIREVLRRMERSADARVDFSLAREIATREGLKALVDGEIVTLGGGYVLSARVVSTQTGDVLATFRETADDQKQIIPAIGKLAKQLRSKIGESLRRIQGAPPLEQVTTRSLEALKRYVQGARAIRSAGQLSKGISLLEEAVALDTGFAMAYRFLAVQLSNLGGQRQRANLLLQKAYDHRDRLSDAERYLTIATYFGFGPSPDPAKSLAAYEALLDIQPENTTALNNAANVYRDQRNFSKAEVYLTRAVALSRSTAVYFSNLVNAQISQGKMADAARTVEEFEKSLPTNWLAKFSRARLVFAEGRHDSAQAIIRGLSATASDVPTREGVADALSRYAFNRGQIATASRFARERRAAERERGVTSAPLLTEVDQAVTGAWFLGANERASRTIDEGLARYPLESIPAAERPYTTVASALSLAGRPDRARAMVAQFERVTPIRLLDEEIARHMALGDIALAEKRFDEAVIQYLDADKGRCTICALPLLARAYDLGGKADSAITVFTRYVEATSPFRDVVDPTYLAGAYKRLGELHEAKGDRAKAVTYYTKFADLWKNADPELQPKVAEVKQRLTKLRDVERR